MVSRSRFKEDPAHKRQQGAHSFIHKVELGPLWTLQLAEKACQYLLYRNYIACIYPRIAQNARLSIADARSDAYFLGHQGWVRGQDTAYE